MNDLSGDDPLWPHFGPLWRDLQATASQSILIAGGYGLFLKQKFLRANVGIPVVVPLDRWPNASPRVTNDLDLVIGLDLIADEKTQHAFKIALDKHGFSVNERNPRWQFEKRVSETHRVVVDLHAPLPAKDQSNLQTHGRRVKRKPSLGEEGIHGHTNPEAVGCDLHPFRFEVDGTSILVPNPVTWSIMKLTAMSDRWRISDDATQSADKRGFSRSQAIKHAQDVCRVVALVTRDENETAPTVVEALRATPEFTHATHIFNTLLTDDERLAAQIAAGWSPEDLKIIRTTLSRWFR